LNEAPGFYSKAQLLFNKTSGRMVRGNGFCPEIIHVSYSNRNNDKHPPVLTPMAARSKARDCGRSFPGIAGSNSPGGGGGCLSLVSVVYCQVEVSLTGRSLVQRRLPRVIEETHRGDLGPRGQSNYGGKIIQW